MPKLIDADQLITEFMWKTEWYDNQDEDIAIDKVYDATTIDAKLVEYGQWMPVVDSKDRSRHECSNCRNYAPTLIPPQEYLSVYCPNCGAEMKYDYVK